MRDSKNLPQPKTSKRHARLQYLAQVLDELHLFVSTTDLRSSQKDCDALADEITPLVHNLREKVETSLPIEILGLRLAAVLKRSARRAA